MKAQIINLFSLILILLGGCLILPLITALIYAEYSSAMAFLITIAICIIPGMILRILFKPKAQEYNLKIRHTYFIVSATWILASLVGCIPFLISGAIPDFFDAFFESVSGFTTTGASILDDIEILPKSMLMWRSFTQWLGGMGIIVLFVALLPSLGIKARNIAKAETPGMTVTRLTSRYTGTAQKLYVLYFVLTLVQTILLMLSGLSLFDSVNHAFTTMATGGFSTYNQSIAYFDNPLVSWIIIVFMLIAGTNFELFFMIANDSRRKIFKNEEFRLYLIIVIATTIVFTYILMHTDLYSDLGKALTDSAFHIVSIITTTGYALTNHNLWPSFCHILLLALMFTGACSSSTAGGFKLVRIKVMFKMYIREVKVKLHGNIVRDVSLDGRKLTSESVTYLVGFSASYFITILLSTILISIADGGDFETVFSTCLSCIGNNGAGFGAVGPGNNFGIFTPFTELLLSFLMIAGRLELSTFFIIFSKYFWRPHCV